MRRTQCLPQFLLVVAFMGLSVQVWASAIESERLAARLRAYAQLAGHNLLQITLLVPKEKSNLGKAADGSWRLDGHVLCIDVAPLREVIETHDVQEIYGGARTDNESLAAFMRDEREAAAKGTTVKALRAERAKRAEEKTRKITAAVR